jgi:hypothetical protein
MKFRYYILFALAVFMLVISSRAKGGDISDLSREYKIKAAFLYNFIQFVDWPDEKIAGQNDPIILGIIGKDPFGDSFEPIKNKQIKGRDSLVNRFESMEKLKESDDKGKSAIESLKKCHLLFICSSEKEHLKDIIKLVDGHGVLTVGETSTMLKSGGVINFLVEENKVRFEINLSSAKQEKLKIRSQLLRLATRVIEDNNSQEK